MARQTEKSIRESLLGQLRDKGADTAHFVDLVEQYINFYKLSRKLEKDIKENGVKYMEISSVGVERKIENPAIKELVGVNRQMLCILRELGLTTDNVIRPEDDEL